MRTEVYACYNLNENERSISSSGGIYPLIARGVLNNGYTVYAACYTENLDVAHKRIENNEDLINSQGSKYVQSYLQSTLKDVLTDLINGSKVLFVGTPCQCYAVASIVEEKKLDRFNIVLIDFVCHGVTSRAAWRAYRVSFRKHHGKLVKINMRDKSTGWRNANYAWKEITETGQEFIIPRKQAIYMKGMIANLYTRPCCTDCRFKGIDRCTDITLGDYWGVKDILPDMDDDRGTSLVLVHTPRGKDIMNSIRCKIKLAKGNIAKAIDDNPCITESTTYNPLSEKFYQRISKDEDFCRVVENLVKPSLIRKVWRKIRTIV